MGPVWGIDFGKKLSGNTVICEKNGDLTRFYRASKDTDADKFITGLIKDVRPEIIFIDAPLSLPAAYHDSENYQDYFYRLCDRQLKAMSPMFLGGLTARAIKMKTEVEKLGIDIK
jgi:predicted nuclease with RNAse H fold